MYQNRDNGFALRKVLWNRVLDVNDRGLRDIVTGMGGNARKLRLHVFNRGLNGLGIDRCRRRERNVRSDQRRALMPPSPGTGSSPT